jgi:hypothetical protein
MEPTGLAYVVVIVANITLVSPDAVPVERCEYLKKFDATVMCIEKEPDCGRAKTLPRCKDDPLPRKRYARKR